jgi:hypothetical protein
MAMSNSNGCALTSLRDVGVEGGRSRASENDWRSSRAYQFRRLRPVIA